MKTLLATVVFSLAVLAQTPAPQPPAPPEISADLGHCSAEFKITDMGGKPIYNAKITTQIRYGFLGTRKLDLELGTDASGRAKFTKLPAQAKRAITFTISHAQDTAEIGYDPATNCAANYVVPLGKKEAKE
jgi:hypothetical protein